VREIRSLGSMRRDVETEPWRLDCGTAIRKGRQQLRGAYRHRATSRPYDALRANTDLSVVNEIGRTSVLTAMKTIQFYETSLLESSFGRTSDDARPDDGVASVA
jgi:hypothetical protein